MSRRRSRSSPSWGSQPKREDTGKLFPVSDRADTVLQALLAAVRAAGVVLEHPRRVETIERGISPGAGKPPAPGPFLLGGAWGSCTAGRVILATGGASLPKSGSDGHGYDMARALGHRPPELLPALVPLTLPDGHFLRALSGLAAPAEITVHAATGRRIGVARGPVLCTHFGVSGPAVLDISRQGCPLGAWTLLPACASIGSPGRAPMAWTDSCSAARRVPRWPCCATACPNVWRARCALRPGSTP